MIFHHVLRYKLGIVVVWVTVRRQIANGLTVVLVAIAGGGVEGLLIFLKDVRS